MLKTFYDWVIWVTGLLFSTCCEPDIKLDAEYTYLLSIEGVYLSTECILSMPNCWMYTEYIYLLSVYLV